MDTQPHKKTTNISHHPSHPKPRYQIRDIQSIQQHNQRNKQGFIQTQTLYKCLLQKHTNDIARTRTNIDLFGSKNHRNRQHFTKLVEKHNLKKLNHKYCTQLQPQDLKYIQPPLHTPLLTIHKEETNSDKDIVANQPTIKIEEQQAYIYEIDGKYLAAITKERFHWLWNKYNNRLNIQQVPLYPTKQDVATEIVWMIQRYIPHKTPRSKDSMQEAYQHDCSLHEDILQSLMTTYNLNFSYYYNPLTCPIGITQYYSLYPRDKMFGSKGHSRQHRWEGKGLHTPLMYNLPYKHYIGQELQHNTPPTPPPYYWSQIDASCRYETPQWDHITTQHTLLNLISTHMKIQIPIQNPQTLAHYPNLWKDKRWDKTPLLPIHTNNNNKPTYPTIAPTTNHPKYNPQNTFYTDGSLKQSQSGHGIHGPYKNINISSRLPSLQTILITELMAINDAIQLTSSGMDPTFIFIDSLTSLQLI